ncbi:MAG: hypothetical protein AAGM84_03220 [Pseudomonadota bacterium]
MSLALQTFTSIAPKINRTVQDQNIGLALQRQCYDAARTALGHVVSINYDEEIETIQGLYPEAVIVSAGPQETCPFPYPLVEFARVQDAVAAQPDLTHVGIINADVYLGGVPDKVFDVIAHDPNAAVIFCRQEADNLSVSSARPYLHGFDFCIFPRAAFEAVKLDGLAWGVPWWDYALPLLMHTAGTNLYICTDAKLLHFTHDVNWSVSLWSQGLSAFYAAAKDIDTDPKLFEDFFDMLDIYLKADGLGHEHEAMLYTGGTLFARACLRKIFKVGTVL